MSSISEVEFRHLAALFISWNVQLLKYLAVLTLLQKDNGILQLILIFNNLSSRSMRQSFKLIFYNF